MGAYHTIELELNRKFTLAKKSWDSVVLDRIGKQVPPLTCDWDLNLLIWSEQVEQKISLSLIFVFSPVKLTLPTPTPTRTCKHLSDRLTSILSTRQNFVGCSYYMLSCQISVSLYLKLNDSCVLFRSAHTQNRPPTVLLNAFVWWAFKCEKQFIPNELKYRNKQEFT